MTEMIATARPYAKAAFEYAIEQKQLPQWSSHLQKLATLIQQPMLQQIIKNPKYSSEQLAEICLAADEKNFDAAIRNFIKLLAANHRLIALPEIASLFEKYCEAQKKQVDVEVKSVIELDSNEQEQLVAALVKKLGCNVVLKCEIDPTLISGLHIRAGDLVIDGSVRGQLARMREELIR